MSANATCSASEIAGAIAGYSKSLHPAYASLMVLTVFTTLLLPLLVVIFYFSNAAQRKTAMFICVVLSVALTIAGNVSQVALVFKGLYGSFNFSSAEIMPLLVLTGVLNWLPNFFAELALLFRMLVVYPPATTPRTRLLLIIVPPVLLKLIRTVSIIAFIVQLKNALLASTSGVWSEQAQNWVIVERACSAVDNGYATTLFLWRIRSTFLFSHSSAREAAQNYDSMIKRIKTLCWLAGTSFLIPFPLTIAQLALTITSPNTQAFSILQNVVNFISAACIAFATVWGSSASARRSTGNCTESSRNKTASTLSARRESRRLDPEADSIQLKSLDHPLHVRVDLNP